jgi:hypothetical protein
MIFYGKQTFGKNFFNLKKTNGKNFSLSTHAEITSLKKLLFYIKNIKLQNRKFDLYVYRQTTTGKLASSKPCLHCFLTIQKMCSLHNIKINYIFYSTPEGTIYQEKFNNLSNLYTSKGNRNLEYLQV